MHIVYCCGSNGSGQLGIGHEEDVEVPTACFQSEIKIVDICLGSNHTLILLENGELYAAGQHQGYFRNKEDSPECKTFELVRNNVTHVGAGWDFSIVVDDENQIFVYGVSGITTIGKLGATESDAVLYIRTSLDGVIVAYESGKLFCWGNNKKGQLLGDCCSREEKMIQTPTEIGFDDAIGKDFGDATVVSCCMGRDYTIFLLRDPENGTDFLLMRAKNDRYSIFRGLHHLIGAGDIVGEVGENRTWWFPVDDTVHVERVMSMWSSVHVLYTDTGSPSDGRRLVSSGNNVYGQNYRNTGYDFHIGSASVGTEHGLVVDDLGKNVYAWGWGEHGNCGDVVAQQHLDGELNLLYQCGDDSCNVATSVFAGYATTWMVLDV